MNDNQLDHEIIEEDLQNLAGCFDNVNDYMDKFGLNLAEQTDINDLVFRRGTQAAMREVLRLWLKNSHCEGTYRTLIELTLSLEKGEVSLHLCKYVARASG